jgi:hypothetical protein
MATLDNIDKLDQLAGFYVQGNQSAPGLLPLQAPVSTPDVEGLERGTGLLNPPLIFADLLSHFPEDLYDLRPQSHLYRFLQALLGPSGVGQLHKRTQIARLESILSGSHFYDLDGFYGSILGELRRDSEKITFNPMDSLATVEEWEEVFARDAQFRARIESLAKGIPLGATIPGLKQIAESLVSAPCDIYEIWKILDFYGEGLNVTYTWDDVTDSYPNWNNFYIGGDPTHNPSWNVLTGKIFVGLSETPTPSEVVVRVKKKYTEDAAGDTEKIVDKLSITRVLSKFKPAGVLITVDTDGLAMHREVPMAGIYSDDNFWEVHTRIAPKKSNVYALSSGSALNVSTIVDQAHSVAVPPFSSKIGHKHSAMTNLSSVNSYTLEDPNSFNWDHTGPRGTIQDIFTPDRGVTDPKTIRAALLIENNALLSHSYSGARSSVAEDL